MFFIYVLNQIMDIRTSDLVAFLKIYELGTISKAANDIGMTQSALSQKVQRLEDLLHAPIFVRHPRHLELTSSGEKLLIYAKTALNMQDDFFKSFDQYQEELSGIIRIAGYSSVMRSMIQPKLAQLMLKHPSVNIEFSVHEMFELESILKTNSADMIITDYLPQVASFEVKQIEQEEYVIIESRTKPQPDIFLDHGHFDNATKSFFEFQGSQRTYTRRFMGDVYSIIDGVHMGLGSAVMSKHLIERDKRFKVKKSSKRYIRPVVLSCLKQTYYSPLHKKVLEAFA